LSKPFFLENLKRYWVVPVAAFIAYFFSAIFGLMLNDNPYQLVLIMHNHASTIQPGIIIFAAVFTLSISVALNRYLYAPNSVNAIHVLPLGRGKLYTSNVLSGLVIIWLPLIVTYLLMYLFIPSEESVLAALNEQIRGGAVFGPGFVDNQIEMLHQIPLGLAQTLGNVLLLTGFYFGLCTVAGQLTGNSVMHIIACAFLALVVPALVGLFGLFSEQMLFGFAMSDDFALMLLRLTPVLYLAMTSYNGGYTAFTQIEPVVIVCYVIITIGLFAAGAALYAKRRNEKAGDGTVYRFMEVAFTSVLTLGGAVGLGEIFTVMNAGAFPFNLGTLIGAVVAFFISSMIALKTLRVFTKSNVRQLGIICAAILVIFCAFTFDIFGYETRIPAAEDVESVSVYPNGLFRNDVPGYGDVTFSDPANIAAIVEIHKSVVAERPVNAVNFNDSTQYVAGYKNSIEDSIANFSVTYKLKNGGTLKRVMSTVYSLVEPYAAKIYGTDEYNAQLTLQAFDRSLVKSVYLNNVVGTALTLSSSEFSELLNLAEQDQLAQTWEQNLANQARSSGQYYVEVEFYAEKPSSVIGAIYDMGYRGYQLNIGSGFTKTLEWLENTGYKERLDEWFKNVTRLEMTLYNRQNDVDVRYTERSGTERVTITDRDKLQLAAESASRNLNNVTSSYWELTFYAARSGQYASDSPSYPKINDESYPIVTLFTEADSELARKLLAQQ
jgi:ABC-2 type transport system permease protein